jgi:tetratricopeptide (TPR) repeat protein
VAKAGALVSGLHELLDLLSSIPGAAWLWHKAVEWWSLPFDQALWEFAKLALQILGGWEFVWHIYGWIFRRRRIIEDMNKLLREEADLQRKDLAKLGAEKTQLAMELASTRDRLPETARARAEREWGQLNQELAARHLEVWFANNAESIAAIALSLAKFHIARSVPDPGDHLTRARDLLRLARGATPQNKETHELSGELDAVNAALQEQFVRDGETQIAWNTNMGRALAGQGEALLPMVDTFRRIAQFCYAKGLWRLTPIFADRAADLALAGGRALRRTWCEVESDAAFYQVVVGRPVDALRRIEHVLAEARGFLLPRDTVVLGAQFVRAQGLQALGRYGEALAEIDAFAPIQAEVQGVRHPDTLTTRYLRASVLQSLGRCGEALAEIDALAPIQTEVRGAQHPDTLTTRYLRASVLRVLGRYGEALAEIDAFAPVSAEVQGARHPATLTTRYLRASVLLDLGRYGEALAEIDAFAAIRAEVQGARHPDTLTTRYLHADVLRGLGRYSEALAEIDALAPIYAEVQGARHPDTLTTRSLRASALQALGCYGEALAEIDALVAVYAEVLGARHSFTLTVRRYRATWLGQMDRWDEALWEIDEILPIQTETLGPSHLQTVLSRSARIGIEGGARRNVDRTDEMRGIVAALMAIMSPHAESTLLARYRLGRLLLHQGRTAEARAEVSGLIGQFDPMTDPGHRLLRSARALCDMIDERPTEETLIV